MGHHPTIKVHQLKKLALSIGSLLDQDRPYEFLQESNKLLAFFAKRKESAGVLSEVEQEVYDYLVERQEQCRERDDVPSAKVLGTIDPDDLSQDKSMNRKFKAEISDAKSKMRLFEKEQSARYMREARGEIQTAFMRENFAEMESLADAYHKAQPDQSAFLILKVVAQISQKEQVDPELLRAVRELNPNEQREVYGMLARVPIDRAIKKKDYKKAADLLDELGNALRDLDVGAGGNFNTLFPESRVLPSANRWPGEILTHLASDTKLSEVTMRKGLALSKELLTRHLGTRADNREQSALAEELGYDNYKMPLNTNLEELTKRDERRERETGFER